MIDDARLAESLDDATLIERVIRHHLSMTQGQAGEQVRGQAAYRHAVALRKSLEDRVETRAFMAAQQEQTG